MAPESLQREEIDVGTSSNDGISVKFDVDKERMTLAKWVLLGLFVSTIMVFFLYVGRSGAEAKDVFDFYKVTAPPIVTLILGAYFETGRD